MSMQGRTNMQIVVQHVEEKINSGKPFTAYDITKAIRKEKQPTGGWIQHFQVKPIVHDLFYNGDMGSYTRSIIDTPGGNAWLYHEVGYDIWDYMEEEFGYDRPTTTVTSANDNDDNNSDNSLDWDLELGVDDDLELEDDVNNSLGDELFDDEDNEEVDGDYFLVDSGGRVCVPKEDVESIGCYPGDFVEVGFYPNENIMHIFRCHYSQDSTHTVDKSGNIRIRVNSKDMGEKYRVLKIKKTYQSSYLRVEFKEE